jgi:hypothetical protein
MMKRTAAVQEQELFPMKDVTPKKAAKAPAPKSAPKKADAKKPEPKSAPAPAPRRKARGSTAVAIHKPVAPREAKNMIAVQAELPVIRQDGKIEIRAKDAKGERTGAVQQATPYATFNNIMAVVKPLLFKHGLGLTFSTEPMGERILVKGLLQGHGYERPTSFPLPAETSGSKNNVQGWGSSLSYGKRYCTIALLNIVSGAAEDRDTNGFPGDFNRTKDGGLVEKPEEAPKITKDQFLKIQNALTDAGIPEQRFLEKYGLKVVNDLPAELFAAAEKAIKDHVASKQAKR